MGKEVSEVQHSETFMEQVNPAKVRETRMIIGDSYASWRSTHCEPYYTKSGVRLAMTRQPSHPLQKRLSTTFQWSECAGFRAYVLMQELRRRAVGTDCARAQVLILRERLLKLGARVMGSVRRLVIHLPASFPFLSTFRLIACRLSAQSV
jgi:hypothetical protein